MTPERWGEIERLYHLALEHESGGRAAFLAQVCGGDEELRKEVESLLAADEGAESYLEIPALELAAQQLVGQTVSHYRIVEKLGSGASQLYLAEDLKLPRAVVVRFLPGVAIDKARVAAAASHPNLCTVYDIDEFEGTPFVVLELLEGQTLEQRMAAKPLKSEELIEWSIEIADGLEAAHSRGIAHGDLRTANIFVTARGQVKILGLGFAGAQELDEASDVMSFGRVLREMAAGQADLPGRLRDIIGKATERDRDVRYQHLADLRVDLKRLKREWDAARLASPGRIARLGRYQILAELAKGGMGAVYEGIDPAIGRTVAIKTILPDGLGMAEEAPPLRERLLREARAAGALAHPNIVTVFDVGEEGGVTYIVMEFIHGVTLDELMRRTPGTLPVERALPVLADAARALDYAHAKGVVHRDVKPGNIMIQEDGVVKLTDFGIAKVSAAGTLTAPGSLAGTPCFIAPEQLRGQEATARSDQFSLGVVAWMLLTGSRPFDAEQLAALVSQILMKEPERSSLLGAEADGILRRALAKDPAERFASCGEFTGALAGACRVPMPAPAGKRNVLRTGLAAAATLAAVGGLIFYATRPGPRTDTVEKEPAIVSPTPVPTTAPTAAPTPVATPASVTKAKPKENRAPAAGSVKVNPVDELPYVWIPAGSFVMGCSGEDAECAEDEKPAHRVTIKNGFRMGQTETTVSAFQRYVKAIGRAMPPEPVFNGQQLNSGWADGRQPVVGVTYAEARNYCEWAGMRLPPEGEWEYAARGGDARLRYGPPDEIAWFADNSGKKKLHSNQLWRQDQAHYDETLRQNENGPHAVGEKAANGFGLRDMLGNVWEWVEDWFDREYYAHSPEVDPPGPPGGLLRVLRGGSWYKGSRFIRASSRHPARGPARNVIFGFRCAGTLPSDK